MKRSLTIMENFMPKAFHHIQTPLHVMLTTGDLVHEKFKNVFMELAPAAAIECVNILQESINT